MEGSHGEQTKTSRTWDAVIGLLFLGVALLLPVALISYHPRDIPAWVPLISTTTVSNPVMHNLCGVIGAIVAGYLYFLFGAQPPTSGSSFSRAMVGQADDPRLFPAGARGLGISLRPVRRVPASVATVVSSTGERPFASRVRAAGSANGSVKRLRRSAGPVGAPVVLLLIYLVSLILATGFHPILVGRKMWNDWRKARPRPRKNASPRWRKPSAWRPSSASWPSRRKNSSASSAKSPPRRRSSHRGTRRHGAGNPGGVLPRAAHF